MDESETQAGPRSFRPVAITTLVGCAYSCAYLLPKMHSPNIGSAVLVFLGSLFHPVGIVLSLFSHSGRTAPGLFGALSSVLFLVCWIRYERTGDEGLLAAALLALGIAHFIAPQVLYSVFYGPMGS